MHSFAKAVVHLKTYSEDDHSDNDSDTDTENDENRNGEKGNISDPTKEAEKAEQKHAKEMLKKVWDLLSDETKQFSTVAEVLESVDISQDEFENYLSMCSNSQTIYYKRRIEEQWINNYNPHLIRAWNGNMDIQYVMDPYSCVMYIVSYISKSEREMGDLIRNAQREAVEGNDEAVAQLRKLGSLYLHHREISVMGSIYNICGLPLQMSSRKVIFVQTDKDGQKISKPLRMLQNNADEDDNPWQNTHIDKYISRPNNTEFNNMCMATFFSQYHYISTDYNKDEEDTDQSDDDELAVSQIPQTNRSEKKKTNKLLGHLTVTYFKTTEEK